MYKRLRLNISIGILFIIGYSITSVGQVIYKDINTTLAPTQFVSIDIDSDGDNEIQIINNTSRVNLFTPTISPGAANVQLLTNSFATSTVDKLGIGEVIGAANSSSFRNGVANGCIGSCLSQHPAVWPSSVSDVYIAFRFTNTSTGFQHYGWMWVDVAFSGTTVLQFTIKGIAYESTPNGDVTTGFIPVSSITIQGQGGATTISTPSGTLQMITTIAPANATNQNVSWTVINGTGTATINSLGVLTALTNGTVTVQATAQDGSSVSGLIDIVINSTLSNNEIIQNDLKVNIYPNPFDNDIYINVKTAGNSNNTEIVLVDLTGKVLYSRSKNLILGENIIELEKLNLSGGFYNLIISSKNKTLVRKIVKF